MITHSYPPDYLLCGLLRTICGHIIYVSRTEVLTIRRQYEYGAARCSCRYIRATLSATHSHPLLQEEQCQRLDELQEEADQGTDGLRGGYTTA